MGLACVLLDLLLGKFCLACGKVDESWICRNCKNYLEPAVPECYGCRRLNNDFRTHASCKKEGDPYENMFILWKYGLVAEKFMEQFKYAGAWRVAETVRELMVEKNYLRDFFLGEGVKNIVAMPLHRSRKRERGYNQAEILGSLVASFVGGRLLKDIVGRGKNNRQQAHLNAKERRKNVKGIFYVNKEKILGIKKLLIVDDVLTTGSTMNELGNEIKKANPEIKLYGLCLFRG